MADGHRTALCRARRTGRPRRPLRVREPGRSGPPSLPHGRHPAGRTRPVCGAMWNESHGYRKAGIDRYPCVPRRAPRTGAARRWSLSMWGGKGGSQPDSRDMAARRVQRRWGIPRASTCHGTPKDGSSRGRLDPDEPGCLGRGIRRDGKGRVARSTAGGPAARLLRRRRGPHAPHPGTSLINETLKHRPRPRCQPPARVAA